MAFTIQGTCCSRSVNPFASSETALLPSPDSLFHVHKQNVASSICMMSGGNLFAERLPKNLNIFWAVASSIAIWFLFIHAPTFIIRRKVYADFPLATHLVGAYTIYLACMFNTLFTPSTLGGKARPLHIWVGRIGMVAGIVSFGFGLFCAWWPYRAMPSPIGFSIGITIGGVAQILTQRAGFLAIQRFQALGAAVNEMENANISGEDLDLLKEQKESALRAHVNSMVGLFVLACGIPAALRIADLLPDWLGFVRVVGVIVILMVLSKSFADSYFKPETIV